MNNTFSIKEVISKSWNIVKKNLKLLIPLLLIVWIVQIGLSSLQTLSDNTVINLILSIVSWVISTLITIGLLTVSLKFVGGGIADFKTFFDKKDKLIPYLVGTIYYSLIVFVGLILLIVPGIIWAIRYQYYNYLILDKDMSPKEALSKSKEITKGQFWKLVLFGIAIFAINLLGLLALVVGLLITIPITMLAMAMVYKSLLGEDTPTPTEFSTPTPASGVGSENNMWATFRQDS